MRVVGDSPPFVPAGDSAWECGTNIGIRAKAKKDYETRTVSTYSVGKLDPSA
jgi:hypothetical protein